MNKEIEDIKSKMSRRLITICEMLRDSEIPVSCVADVGCDHGYISIYLVSHDIADRAIAMDVRKGPLSGAGSNIEEYGQQDKITTRLSDGLKEVSQGEADTVVVAGMGGKLMIKILEEGNPKALGIRKGILQPQSEIPEFRKYLREKGYSITDEQIVLEDGKYYFPMKVRFLSESFTETDTNSELTKMSGDYDIALNTATDVSCDLVKDASAGADPAISRVATQISGATSQETLRICDRFGAHNILRRDPLLRDYCLHGREVCASILKNLVQGSHGKRYTQVTEELSDIEKVLSLFEK